METEHLSRLLLELAGREGRCRNTHFMRTQMLWFRIDLPIRSSVNAKCNCVTVHPMYQIRVKLRIN